jgi:UDP-N-acetylglucosamine--N-acetylmuramyl-(pentapeptide) pyrophosphoryl-undecaprenol N-acetylglucosamine transferase
MKIMMVGGGTGGHVYPAIAIAQAIQEIDINSQILFVGSEGGIETNIVPKERYSIVTIKVKKMLRKLTLASLMSPFYAVKAIFDSFKIIKDFKPDAIVATGGFVSLPVVIAGAFLRIPIVLNEGNVTPGLSTKLCKWFASAIMVAFEESRKYYRFRKVYNVGGPVRKEVIKANKSIAIQKMGLKQDKKILLVMGGSQGARSINRMILELLPELSQLNIQVIHVCGERDKEMVDAELKDKPEFYHLLPYMYNIWDGLAAADVAISRAGATAISEIIVKAVPTILIPFPYSAENHQDTNAKLLGDRGAAFVINESDLTKEKLMNEIKDLLTNKERRERMQNACKAIARIDSASEIAGMIFKLVAKNKGTSELDTIKAKGKKKTGAAKKTSRPKKKDQQEKQDINAN